MRALKTYWYLRLVEGTPGVYELYQGLITSWVELRKALGLTSDALREYIEEHGFDALNEHIRQDGAFVKQHKFESLRETLTLDYPMRASCTWKSRASYHPTSCSGRRSSRVSCTPRSELDVGVNGCWNGRPGDVTIPHSSGGESICPISLRRLMNRPMPLSRRTSPNSGALAAI